MVYMIFAYNHHNPYGGGMNDLIAYNTNNKLILEEYLTLVGEKKWDNISLWSFENNEFERLQWFER